MMRLKNKSGFIYIMAMAVLVIFSTLSLAYVKIAKSSLKVGQDEMQALQAFYYAESGAEVSFAEIKTSTDIDGYGGIGNVNWQEITPEGSVNSYVATYDSAKHAITATGTRGEAQRKETVILGRENFQAAIQGGATIYTTAQHTGTVNGHVAARSVISPPDMGGLSVNGTIKPGQTVTEMPMPTLSIAGFLCYRGRADHIYNMVQNWTVGPPAGDGIYYVGANCTISNDFQLNGTLVVNGSLMIQNVPQGKLRIIPNGNNPAIVARSLVITNTEDAFIDGLIFNTLTSTYDSNIGMQVRGAIVSTGTLTFDSLTSSVISFDPAMDPPCFGNMGQLVPNAWKGHEDL